MELQFSINQQHIKRIDNENVVADSRNYLKARFTFSDEWNGLIKTAVFTHGENTYNAILDAENGCVVPWEVIKSGYVHVSVFGGDLITVDKAEVFISSSGYAEGEETKEPSPTVYQQIIAMLEDIETGGIPEETVAKAVEKYLAEHPIESLTEEDVQKIVAEYVTAHKAELKGDKGDQGIQGEKGADGKDGINGKDGAKGEKGEPGAPGVNGTNGVDGKNGKDGKDGYTPIKGTDYFTAEEIEAIESDVTAKVLSSLVNAEEVAY